jgi:hypothetical protein
MAVEQPHRNINTDTNEHQASSNYSSSLEPPLARAPSGRLTPPNNSVFTFIQQSMVRNENVNSQVPTRRQARVENERQNERPHQVDSFIPTHLHRSTSLSPPVGDITTYIQHSRFINNENIINNSNRFRENNDIISPSSGTLQTQAFNHGINTQASLRNSENHVNASRDRARARSRSPILSMAEIESINNTEEPSSDLTRRQARHRQNPNHTSQRIVSQQCILEELDRESVTSSSSERPNSDISMQTIVNAEQRNMNNTGSSLFVNNNRHNNSVIASTSSTSYVTSSSRNLRDQRRRQSSRNSTNTDFNHIPSRRLRRRSSVRRRASNVTNSRSRLPTLTSLRSILDASNSNLTFREFMNMRSRHNIDETEPDMMEEVYSHRVDSNQVWPDEHVQEGVPIETNILQEDVLLESSRLENIIDHTASLTENNSNTSSDLQSMECTLNQESTATQINILQEDVVLQSVLHENIIDHTASITETTINNSDLQTPESTAANQGSTTNTNTQNTTNATMLTEHEAIIETPSTSNFNEPDFYYVTSDDDNEFMDEREIISNDAALNIYGDESETDEEISDDCKCELCVKRMKNTFFLPCGHTCCGKCATRTLKHVVNEDELGNEVTNICPFCRQNVTRIVKNAGNVHVISLKDYLE